MRDPEDWGFAILLAGYGIFMAGIGIAIALSG